MQYNSQLLCDGLLGSQCSLRTGGYALILIFLQLGIAGGSLFEHIGGIQSASVSSDGKSADWRYVPTMVKVFPK